LAVLAIGHKGGILYGLYFRLVLLKVQRCVRLVSYIASGLGPDILSRCAISYFSRTKSLFHNSSKISSRNISVC